MNRQANAEMWETDHHTYPSKTVWEQKCWENVRMFRRIVPAEKSCSGMGNNRFGLRLIGIRFLWVERLLFLLFALVSSGFSAPDSLFSNRFLRELLIWFLRARSLPSLFAQSLLVWLSAHGAFRLLFLARQHAWTPALARLFSASGWGKDAFSSSLFWYASLLPVWGPSLGKQIRRFLAGKSLLVVQFSVEKNKKKRALSPRFG